MPVWLQPLTRRGSGEGFHLDRVDVPATRHALQTARRVAKQTAAGAKLDPAQQVPCGGLCPRCGSPALVFEGTQNQRKARW